MMSCCIRILARVVQLGGLSCLGCGLIAGVEDGTLAPPDGGAPTSSASGTGAGTSTSTSTGTGAGGGTGGGCGCDYAAVVLEDQPVAYWRLGEGMVAATAEDEVGRHPGTYNAGTSPGKAGAFPCDTAVEFHQPGSVSVADSPELEFLYDGMDGSDSFALEAWIKTTEGGSVCGKTTYEVPDGGDTAQYAGYLLVARTGPFRVAFVRGNGMEGGVATLNADAPADEWIHVVAQYNGSQKFLYVNATTTPATQNDTHHDQPDLAVDFMIGDAPWGNFEGLIDEVAVYDHTLEPDRIAAHHAACPRR